MLFFGLLLTFLLTANLASAQTCQPAACSKATAEKSSCAKATTTTSTAAVNVDEIIKMVSNTSATTAVNTAACTKACDPSKCTEEEKQKCASVCPPGCCTGAKSAATSVKNAEVKTAQKETKSSKL